jgi:hypothetical protein
VETANHVLSAVVLCAISQSVVWAQGGKPAAAPAQFATATVHLEQNATDGDAEVVFEIKGGDDGLSKLTVKGPDGRTVIDFTASDPKTLGMRQFRFESPEPRDIKALKAAYPEGAYTFNGATASGARLQSTATLHHTLPAAASLVTKGDDLPSKNLSIKWTPVKGLSAYVVYVERLDADVNVTVKLPGTAHSFAVPDDVLSPGKSYQLGIGTVTEHGNISFVETTFITAAKP